MPVTLLDVQIAHILQTLQETKGVIGGRNGAAARLGMARTTLIYRMKRLGITHCRQDVEWLFKGLISELLTWSSRNLSAFLLQDHGCATAKRI
jgi:hypothetical protein